MSVALVSIAVPIPLKVMDGGGRKQAASLGSSNLGILMARSRGRLQKW